MLMVMCMKVSGATIRQRVKELILMQMVLTTRELGLTTNSMAVEPSHGPMVLAMRVTMKRAKKREKAG